MPLQRAAADRVRFDDALQLQYADDGAHAACRALAAQLNSGVHDLGELV